MSVDARSYLRVKDIPDKYPAFSQSSIRWVIFNAGTNGFDKVIRKVGRRVLIDEESFVAWIEGNTRQAA